MKNYIFLLSLMDNDVILQFYLFSFLPLQKKSLEKFFFILFLDVFIFVLQW